MIFVFHVKLGVVYSRELFLQAGCWKGANARSISKRAKELEGYPKIHFDNRKHFGITKDIKLIFSLPFIDAPGKCPSNSSFDGTGLSSL